MFDISIVRESDLDDLLPLMRGYCDFYKAGPSDQGLLAMSRALIDDPEYEGLQLIARNRETDKAAGFASLFWTWSTLQAARLGIMNDLFVAPEHRGSGLADALILACAEHCAARGASEVCWQTALDNRHAQAVYERVGAKQERWLDYSLPARSG